MFNNFKLNRLTSFQKLFVLISILGIIFEVKFQLLRPVGRELKVSLGRLKNYNSSCYLPLIKELPKNSTIIIGHAYGAHKKNYKLNKDDMDFIAPKISAFLDNNKYLIKEVIFNGDIFKIPSVQKWQKLLSKYDNQFNIIISPGNHDIGGNQKNSYKYKDIFSKNVFNLNLYPFTFESNGFNLIVENSVERINLNNNKINQIIRTHNYKNLQNIIIRHHIPIRELAYLSNEKFNFKRLPSHLELEKNIKDSIIISGDGGAFKHLPRLTCNNLGSNTFIVNGIGENPEDRIVILSKKNLFQMKVK